MYAPVKTAAHRRAVLINSVLVALAIVGIAVFAIGAVRAQTPLPRPSASPPPAQQASRALLGYQVRCWQQGHLLLEETLAQPPAERTAQSIRMYGGPGAGGTYTLFSLGTTTCFVKPASDR